MSAPLLESMDDAADALYDYIIFRREVCLSRRNNPPEASFFLGDRGFLYFIKRFDYAGWILMNFIATYFWHLNFIMAFYPYLRLSCILFSHLSISLTCLVLRFYIDIYEFPIYEFDFDWDADS